jgi:hypothetical protein
MNRLKEELINRRDILFDNYLELDEKISRWISGDLQVRSSNDPNKTRQLIRFLKDEKARTTEELLALDVLICKPDKRQDGLEEVY